MLEFIYKLLLQIGEYMDVDLPSTEEHPHVVRVGFSTENSTMNLGWFTVVTIKCAQATSVAQNFVNLNAHVI